MIAHRSFVPLFAALLLPLANHALAQGAPLPESVPAQPAQERVPAPTGAPIDSTPQTPTVPQHSSSTELTPRSAPERSGPPRVPSEPPSTLSKVADTVSSVVRIYGILKPTITFASDAVESFGNVNASAPTAAANPVLAGLRDERRLTFQAAQSRFGLWINEQGSYRGHVEFDFIDFAKASPTVQALVRLRIATVEWSPTSELTLVMGQDWDLDAPVNAFGVNLVGTHFQAGNHGFMRHQLKALYRPLSALELGFALGLASANPTPRDNNVELGQVPTFALRVSTLGKFGRLGVSALATRLRFSPGPMERHALGAIGSLFGDLIPYASLSLRFEGYVGRNAASLGTLAIGSGRVDRDVEEAGFFVSARQSFGEHYAAHATYGQARALDVSEVAPSYAYPAAAPGTPPGALPELGSASASGSGSGFRWNQQLRLGLEYKPVKALAIGFDAFWYQTQHQLQAVDRTRSRSKPMACGGDFAMVYTF